MSNTSDTATSIDQGVHFLENRYRCPEGPTIVVDGPLSPDAGYFSFGPDIVCYGRCSSATPEKGPTVKLPDTREAMVLDGARVHLPFDPQEIVDNLRCERYFTAPESGNKPLSANALVRKIYYGVRPLLGVAVRKHIQRFYFRRWDKSSFPKWPVDRTVEDLFAQILIASMQARGVTQTPFIWFWPDGAKSCSMVTHDVETAAGLAFCPSLMDINDSFGIKSSFQIVPEKRYAVSSEIRETIRNRGFEVNIHDLNHDGYLFRDRDEFERRAKRINEYAVEFGAKGFRSAVMYRKVDWLESLHFDYDMSLPNVAHLDPQQGGCCTVFPFFIGNLVELPLTTTQDYSLFHILSDHSLRLWKEQIAAIREANGLISFIFHPDYIIDLKARETYRELLAYLSELRAQGQTWIALPRDVAEWWRQRSQLRLVGAGDSWRIEGAGRERARLAYAKLIDGKLVYEVQPA